MTLASTTLVGADYYRGFLAEFTTRTIPFDWNAVRGGLWYSLTVLGILGAHEMGHYLACRRYQVDATLPYFLPFPLGFAGTLGAVIRIKEAFPDKRVLFDIAVAGPLAGFAVLVPALFLGLHLSTVVSAPPPDMPLVHYGEPLLLQWSAALVIGQIPDGSTLNTHPIVFACWFGMLATALNLLPFGQFDGGHISYAALGRWSTPISMATAALTLAMTFISISWLLMAVVMLAMLFVLGPRHPRVIDEYEPLGRGRQLIALFALVILATCVIPIPIELPEGF